MTEKENLEADSNEILNLFAENIKFSKFSASLLAETVFPEIATAGVFPFLRKSCLKTFYMLLPKYLSIESSGNQKIYLHN